ncbi:MAG: hypothetical protein A3G38_04325 [Omnitrophica WOR_2 bacterium RIFCSPLOWO2_12_FULL_51_8]|nr:MAG: hypothetical protein A3G38_04325 [Omnitrophica WOR_2 bacterium RIFCSPLOWO2_12_FULL_51_8]
MKKEVHVFYSGRVQGVGFRFSARQIAGNLGIVGWVKNLSDGRVELIAQAEERALKDFLSQLKRLFSAYINDIQLDWQEPRTEYREFRVEF